MTQKDQNSKIRSSDSRVDTFAALIVVLALVAALVYWVAY